MNENKKEVAQEVPVQEQLKRWECECIYRHLKMFVQTNWDHKKDIPDACVGCDRYCSKDIQVLDPWPTFYKLAKLAEILKVDEKEHLNKQGNGHIYH